MKKGSVCVWTKDPTVGRIYVSPTKYVQHKIVSRDSYCENYKKLKSIGKGHFGQVFLVEYQGKRFAAKEIRPDEKTIQRVTRETEIMEKLTHENICALNTSFFVHGGTSCLFVPIMEYVEGFTFSQLSAHSSTHNNISESQFMSMAKGVLKALAYMHSKGISHGDIKDGNLMVKARSLDDVPENPKIKVIDFGLARFCDKNPTFGFGGTTSYYSPEKLEMYSYNVKTIDLSTYLKSKIGDSEEMKVIKEVIAQKDSIVSSNTAFRFFRQSDVWAAGIVFYRLVNGKNPFNFMNNIPPKKGCQIREAVDFCDRSLTEIRVKRFVHSGDETKGLDRTNRYSVKPTNLVESILYAIDPEKRPSSDDLLKKFF